MTSILRKSIAAWVAVFLLLTLVVAPQAALARMHLSNGSGGSGGGSAGEGDPLDSNDNDTGGGGDNYHQEGTPPAGPRQILIDIGNIQSMLLLHIEYIDDVPVFMLQIISVDQWDAEAKHVR